MYRDSNNDKLARMKDREQPDEKKMPHHVPVIKRNVLLSRIMLVLEKKV